MSKPASRLGPLGTGVSLGVRAGILILGAVLALTVSAASWAFWTMVGEGGAAAASGTLWAPRSIVADAPINSGTVTVDWEAATLSTGQSATGYYVRRIRDSDGATAPACGTSKSSPITALSCEDAGVADGAYHYTVTGLLGSWTALSGNSPTVTVMNDNSLPTVWASSISPSPNGNGWNNSSPVTVDIEAYAGFGIASITYSVDGQTLATVATDTVAVPVAGDGVHTVEFSAEDNPGNVSATDSVLVRIDTLAPEAPSAPVLLAASDSGASSSDAITKVTAPTLTGTAEAGATVHLFDGATLVGTGIATDGTYTIILSSRPAGGHAFTAQATDLAANQGPVSASTEVNIDTTAPTEAEAGETDDNVFADNADYEAHRSDLFSVMAPIWGDSTADDLVHGEDSMFRDEGLRQMCVIWQSGVRVTSEDEADENMRQVYLSTGASDERAAALVSSLKQNVCTK